MKKLDETVVSNLRTVLASPPTSLALARDPASFNICHIIKLRSSKKGGIGKENRRK